MVDLFYKQDSDLQNQPNKIDGRWSSSDHWNTLNISDKSRNGYYSKPVYIS